MEYQLGLYEKALPSTLSWEEKFAEAKAAGFDYMEISIDETDARQARLKWTPDERRQVRSAMSNAGVPLLSMCLSAHRKYPLGSHDAAIRARSMEIMRDAIDFSADLGIRFIQLAGYDVYYEPSDADTLAYFEENLQKSIEYAARDGVMMGFETMEVPFMDTVAKAMHFVDQVNSPYLGVYPDLGNLTNAAYLYGTDVLEDIRCGRGHMMAMHIKDTKENVYRDLRFGDGRVDFVPGIRTALDCGIRMFVSEFWHHENEDYHEVLRYSNRFVRNCIEEAAKD